MYRTHKAPLTRRVRRMRRRFKAVRPHEWLQYFGLLMLIAGAAMLAHAALNI